nr:zinc finger, CCHC-type [Ipomoea batatas]
MDQFHEIVRILGQIRQHGMNMDDSIAIASIMDKLPPSWKKVHRALLQRKEELTMEQLGSHLYVEEGIRQKESKNKGGARVTGASGSTINLLMEANHIGTAKGKGNRERSPKLLSLRRMEKEKGRLLLDVGCATVHTLKRTVTFGRLEKHKWKVNLLVILANTENFIAMISEICVMQSDDSWWVDTGATGHVCKDINLYKIYKEIVPWASVDRHHLHCSLLLGGSPSNHSSSSTSFLHRPIEPTTTAGSATASLSPRRLQFLSSGNEDKVTLATDEE